MDVRELAPRSDEMRARALVAAASLTLPGQRVRDKLSAGVPLLHDEDVRIDPEIVHSAWREGLRSDSRSGLDGAEHEVEVVQHALDTHRLHAEHVTAEALAGHAEHVRAIAQAARVSDWFVEGLANAAAHLILRGYAELLGPALTLGDWQRGYCPICGAWPWQFVRAASGGPGRLLCGRCGTAWSWHARECPFCGEHDTLRDLESAAGLGGPAALSCSSCRRFLVARATPMSDLPLDIGSPPDSVHRPVTPSAGAADAHALAISRGYIAPAGVGFRLELRGDEPEWDAFDDQ